MERREGPRDANLTPQLSPDLIRGAPPWNEYRGSLTITEFASKASPGLSSSVLLVASSDFTHYEPDETARRLDHSAIEPILALDSARFLDLCRAERLSICGAGAIALLIEVATRLGITDTQLVDYSTSGDTSGDRSAVVGYAAISFSRRNHGS